MQTQVTTRERNQMLLSYLETPGLEKKAVDAVNNFTRTKMREDSFHRKLVPPTQITNDELDRQVDTDKPVKVIDKEADSPAAISLPFANLPINIYIKAPRYRVLFDRIVTPRFTKDVDELRTYVMDIRQVLSDNAIKDMLAEEDSKFLAAVNTALGAKDSTHPIAGTALYQGISGGITRDSVVDALKIMNRTPFRIESHTCLTNFVTWKEFMKWGRDEVGGDLSQDIVKNGMAEEDLLSKTWVVTIKRDLVPDDTVYMFADPKFIGKSFLLEDTTMFIKREAFMIEFFAYETTGGAIGHVGGLARADFE
jgi:hypothetical protein